MPKIGKFLENVESRAAGNGILDSERSVSGSGGQHRSCRSWGGCGKTIDQAGGLSTRAAPRKPLEDFEVEKKFLSLVFQLYCASRREIIEHVWSLDEHKDVHAFDELWRVQLSMQTTEAS